MDDTYIKLTENEIYVKNIEIMQKDRDIRVLLGFLFLVLTLIYLFLFGKDLEMFLLLFVGIVFLASVLHLQVSIARESEKIKKPE